MSLLGRLLAAPVRIVNIPFRAVEKFVATADGGVDREEDRIMSVPLESLAKVIEEVCDGDDGPKK